MSLRVRLVLLIVVVVALAAVRCRRWNWGRWSICSPRMRSNTAISPASKSVRSCRITSNAIPENFPTPQSIDEIKALWNQIVSDDAQLRRLLVKMMASSSSLLEINVAGETGIILASSNDARSGRRCSGTKISKPG